MKFSLLLMLTLVLAFPGMSQPCLQQYFPDDINGSKIVFVLPSWEELNEHHLENCQKYQLPVGELSGKSKFDRFRLRAIRLAGKTSANIRVVSEREFMALPASALDSVAYVVREISMLTDYSTVEGTYNTKSCYQFEHPKSGRKLEMICYDELKACLTESYRGNVYFPDFVLAKCK